MTENVAPKDDAHARWVAFNPNIKILDCTIRDGGLINNHAFTDDLVKAVYNACAEAGVDYIEMGYKSAKRIYAPAEYGAWKFCDEDALRRIVDDNPHPIKISVLADTERTDYHTDILPADQSVIDGIRVACYIHQIPAAIDMLKDAQDKGYETTMQLMAISTVNEDDLKEALRLVADCPAAAVYIVDSFGALYSEQVRALTQLYLEAMKGTGKEVGFHAHNNMQLAFSNTIEALVAGASRLDGTISGIGRGAGNCPLELLIGFLHNPKFKMRPILKCCQEHFVPLAKQLDWGYSIPYAITGQLNQHPRTAIAQRTGDAPDDYVGFYDRIADDDF